MTFNTEIINELAAESSQSYNAEELSELYEQESRRYSRRLAEEEEAKLR